MSLIVALDSPDLESSRKILESLQGLVKIYKVGSELFTAEGWRAVDLVESFGGQVFLDLKLHDIPTTVAKTCRVIAKRGIFMFNLHTLGSLEMMSEARKAVEEESRGQRRPLLIGVTILTSLEERTLSQELGIHRPLQEEVLELARLAKRAGLDGVVSSPEEVPFLRKQLGEGFILVTPGIRPPGSETHDQRRSLSPRESLERGADYLVVGRPITASPNPREAASQILQSLA